MNITREASQLTRQMIINAAATCFLQRGYSSTTIRTIARSMGVSVGCITSHFHSKEDIIYELVGMVIEEQFTTTKRLMMENQVTDPVMMYAAETALQLNIVEMSEHLRDVYCSAYSMPKTSALLQESVTGKTGELFKEYLPDYEAKDFYLLEIASGGVMRGFMTVPCSIWFSMDVKISSFLDSTLRLYYVPHEKIQEAIAFVKTIDLQKAGRETVDEIFKKLDAQKLVLQKAMDEEIALRERERANE